MGIWALVSAGTCQHIIGTLVEGAGELEPNRETSATHYVAVGLTVMKNKLLEKLRSKLVI